jgi:hypothetical protein
MLDLPVLDSVYRSDPETWVLAFLRRIAREFVPDFDVPSRRTTTDTEESRDDNGAYCSEGSFREGNSKRFIDCHWTLYQHEEMIGPAPWRHSHRFQVRGLRRGQRFEFVISRSADGSYTSEASEAMIIVRLQGDEATLSRVEELILGRLTSAERLTE